MTSPPVPGARQASGLLWRLPGLLRRRLIDNAVLIVIALIVVVAALDGLTGPAVGENLLPAQPGWLPGLYIALTVAVAGVVLASRHPWLGLWLVAAAPLASALLGWDPIATWNIAIFATFWLTLRALPGLPAGLLTGAANYAAVALSTAGVRLDAPAASIASIAAVSAIAAAGVGSAIRGHRRYWAELEGRTREAEATWEAEAQRRVAQERVRIARDLHDVVGHQVALVSMHLGAAEVHLPSAADETRRDLVAAREGLQAVLAGTQQILRVLRSASDESSTAPAAGYEHIAELVAASRAAGLEVDATLDEPAVALSPAVSAAAYRIVQEALTNAQKHGSGAVSLRVSADAAAVAIEAVNVLAAPAAAGAARRGGYGLVGMSERAASVGGWISTRTDEPLFWLRAQLPVDEGERR